VVKFVDIICKNILTGELSEFGNIQSDNLRQRLLAALDKETEGKEDDIYTFPFEELIFSANNNIRYTDAEGKKRIVAYSKEDLREYCRDLFEFLRLQTRDFINYTHDIQYLIGALNAASVPKKSHENDLDFIKARMEKINLISILISAKSTFFRFLTEDLENTRKDDVSITGKTFKIHKGIPFLAESHRKNVESTFNSNSKSTIKMIDIFEFIPYTIVENAIKYGPKDLDVDFNIYEDREDIRVAISSLGPKLETNELKRIFERGYRGVAAREGGFPGHGLGLFQANRACKILFGGHIFAEQEQKYINLNSMQYAETNFTIVLPKNNQRK